MRRGEVWAPTTKYQLHGITRQNVLNLCRQHGIPCRELDFSLTQVYSADEAFVTGTFAGQIPVVDVDGRTIGDGARGPVTARLQGLYDLHRRDAAAASASSARGEARDGERRARARARARRATSCRGGDEEDDPKTTANRTTRAASIARVWFGHYHFWWNGARDVNARGRLPATRRAGRSSPAAVAALAAGAFAAAATALPPAPLPPPRP